MEQQSIESYLRGMNLKQNWFGGYDPEDVILKMQELVRIAKASGADQQTREELEKQGERLRNVEAALARQQEQCQQAEADLTQQRERCQQTEAALARQREQCMQAEAALEEERTRRGEAEKEATRLRSSLQESEALRLRGSDEAEKLRSFLTSVEDSKKDILRRYKGKVQKDAERIREESELLAQKNAELKKMVAGESRLLTDAIEQLVRTAEKTKKRIVEWEENDVKGK